jgi:hypothetical protein
MLGEKATRSPARLSQLSEWTKKQEFSKTRIMFAWAISPEKLARLELPAVGHRRLIFTFVIHISLYNRATLL